MSYIGNPPVVQASRVITELVATAGQTDIYPLGGYTPGDYLDVEINGSALKSTDYTATDGVKITLAVAMAAGDDVRVKAYGNFLVGNAVPADGTVTTAKIVDAAVTAAKLAAQSVTQAKLAANVAGNGPAFSATQSGTAQTLSSGVYTLIQLLSEEFDTASCFNNTASTVNGIPAFSFMPNVAGYYQVNAMINYQNGTESFGFIYKNGGQFKGLIDNGPGWGTCGSALVYMNGTTDYISLYGYCTPSRSVAANSTLTYLQAYLVKAA